MTVVILTGASAGIGKAIAEYLLSKTSAKVFLTARTEAPLKKFVEEFGEDRVAYYAGDIAYEETTEQVVKQTVAKFGTINSVIANAGVMYPIESVQGANIKKWKRLFDINFFSVVDLVSRSLPYVRENKGDIILVSSGAALKFFSGRTAYGATKAAINFLATCVTDEFPEVKTLALAPGVVDTELNDNVIANHKDDIYPEDYANIKKMKEENKFLKPSEVAVVYGNIAIKGISPELNGKYARFGDESLKSYL